MNPSSAKPSPLQRALDRRLSEAVECSPDTELDAADLGTAFGLDYSIGRELDLPIGDESRF